MTLAGFATYFITNALIFAGIALPMFVILAITMRQFERIATERDERDEP